MTIRVSFVGNLGSDPETRFTQAGVELVTVRVAVNWARGKDDQRREGTDWFRVKVSGARAAYLGQALHKGSRVLVYGRLEIDTYQSKDGETRTSMDVWADEVQNLTPRDQKDVAMAAGVGAARSSGEPEEATSLEDLPF